MKKIYEEDWWYYRVRNIADPYIRGSYKKLRYEGPEKIPQPLRRADGSAVRAGDEP